MTGYLLYGKLLKRDFFFHEMNFFMAKIIEIPLI